MHKHWSPSFSHFKNLFLQMARMTTPAGHEAYTWASLPNAPHGAPPNAHPNYHGGSTHIDCDNNYIVHIPGADGTLWVAHCDTADSDPTHVHIICTRDELGNEWAASDGKTILGADDKIGCAILACMIKAGVPGYYLFPAGEEIGCVGSKALAKHCKKNDMKFDHVVSIDRKGYTSVITHQLGRRTCSNGWATKFAEMLADSGLLGYKPDDTGVYTDSNEFKDFCAECTNLSCGYFDMHQNKERANLTFAYDLLMALIHVGHIGLPAKERDPSVVEDDYDYLNDSDWYSSFKYRYRSGKTTSTKVPTPYGFDAEKDKDKDSLSLDDWMTDY